MPTAAPGPPFSRHGVHTLWGRTYHAYTCRLPVGGRSALVVRLEEAHGSDHLHAAVVGGVEELARLERLAATDPRRALEAAARSAGLVAAEGPLWGLSLLGFLEATGRRKVVIQYRPGRAIIVVDAGLLRALADAARRLCGDHPLIAAAQRAAGEAEPLAGCSLEVGGGIIYLIRHWG